MAAQEQAISTRAIETRIYQSRSDPRCRLCKEAPETVQHIVAGCKMLAGSAFMERHNQVARIVYRNICNQYGIEVPKSQWAIPQKVGKNNRAKDLWDFSFQTDKKLLANQPDIVVVDKEQKRVVVIDVCLKRIVGEVLELHIQAAHESKNKRQLNLYSKVELFWVYKSCQSMCSETKITFLPQRVHFTPHWIGVLCAYAANQNLSAQVKNIRRLVNSNMRDLHTFANDTPTQIDYLSSQYATTKNQVLYDLDNIGPLLGGRIHHQLDKEVRPALDAALKMTGVKIDRAIKAMRETKEALDNVSVSLQVLQEGAAHLHVQLGLVRDNINNTLDDPGCHDEESDATSAQLCRNIRLSLAQLHISANFTRLPNVNSQLEKMSDVLKTDLSAIVHKGYASLNDTPYMVMVQTRGVVDKVQSLLDDIGSNISSFAKVFPVQKSLANFTIFISHAHAKIEDHYPDIDQMDFYRWTCCVAMCCMVVLVLAFNYLGLLCGTLGYDKHASPTTRGCISNTGGTMLMAGVGFSVIFSWVLMGLLTAIFLLGGNMEKLICEPFHTRELFKVVDSPYLVSSEWKNFIPGYMYNDSELELSAESLYSTCKENKGIYSAMRLDKIFNVSSFLNATVFTKEVVAHLSKVNIDLRGITLLEAEGKQNLLEFSEAGLSETNYADYLEEVNKGVTAEDLLLFAKELEAQTELMPRGRLQSALKGHVGTVRQIHNQHVVPLQQAMKYVRARSALNQSMRFLERTASDLPNKVLGVLDAVDAAQYLISQNATHLINRETAKYTAAIVGYFHQYIEWVKTSLAMEVAPCKPFSNILDTMEIITCSFLVDSMNVFWMGLGCSTLLLIPSIILAVKLAKFYRRMDTEDVYDDMESGNNGYHSEPSHATLNPPMASIPTYDTISRFPRASAPPRHIDW
ncbi:prominin-1-A-like [Entelurus aequoreus]|uniref:prominin-1-A-like n=1 Tax=Entelurus aequoreus TaxID=161455 RepID=UPI002B1D14F8|nr:prominin-1-A-like [Entelurus aequoreus]